jgi:hypothetical protein
LFDVAVGSPGGQARFLQIHALAQEFVFEQRQMCGNFTHHLIFGAPAAEEVAEFC